MLKYWINITKARIADGMDKEVALTKVPVKYRDAVRQAIEDEE